MLLVGCWLTSGLRPLVLTLKLGRPVALQRPARNGVQQPERSLLELKLLLKRLHKLDSILNSILYVFTYLLTYLHGLGITQVPRR
jgi:hypothetical protein